MPYSIFIIKVTLYVIFLNIYHFFIVYVILIEKKNYRTTALEELQPLIHSFEVPKN